MPGVGFAWVGARKAFGSEGLDASALVSVTTQFDGLPAEGVVDALSALAQIRVRQ